jgi:hypothetical protein
MAPATAVVIVEAEELPRLHAWLDELSLAVSRQ